MATATLAFQEAKELKAHLERYGIRVSIELQAGRNGLWWVPKYLVMNHHTATYKRTNPTPALYICKHGRSDVPGPLCNGYGGYDQIFRIITLGLANHPGAGGPVNIDGVHVPQDSMRSPSFGIEWEGGYHTWTRDERRWMAVVNRAVTEFYDRPLTSQLEHKTWAPTRKIDRKDYTRSISITDTRAVTATAPKEVGFLMSLTDAQQREMYDAICGGGRLKEVTLGVRRIDKNVKDLHDHRQPYVRARPTGWKGGDPVYVTDLHSFAHPIEHGGPLDDLVQFLLTAAGFDADAIEISRDALTELEAAT